MGFLIGLFLGLGLLQKKKIRGGVFLQPVGNHSDNPFQAQDERKEFHPPKDEKLVKTKEL